MAIACPTDAVLLAYRARVLDDERAREVARHLAGCARCRKVLSAIASAPVGPSLDRPDPAAGPAADEGGDARYAVTEVDLRYSLTPRFEEVPGMPPAAERVAGVGTQISAGEVRGGTYRLVRTLGHGGMGVVWEATHEPSGSRAAIKLLRERHDQVAVRRFLREARAPALVHHPGILEVQETLALDDGSPAIVMELLQGESLRQRLDRLGRLPLVETARILHAVADAVAAAHRAGVIHRDLKPDNIFLTTTAGGGERVKVLDFGLVKLLAEGGAGSTISITSTGQILGTPHYMAPEQAVGDVVDQRADVWALGVILFECLAGKLPYGGGSAHRVLARIAREDPPPLEPEGGVPPEVARLCRRMLTRRREERLPDLDEALPLLARHGGLVAEGQAGDGATGWRRPGVLLAIAAATLVALAAAAILALR